MPQGKLKGKVKWFNSDKGYGFITPNEGGKDLFFHISNMKVETLENDQEVLFEVVDGKKGPEAVEVTSAN